MEKKLLLSLSAIAVSAILATAMTKPDPVLMTVAGQPVTLSEFEYLYNKNNTQQAEPQSLDEYVNMFVTYKLKVADARAAGIDTTASFVKEFTGYFNDLADPYLRDASVDEQLIREAYAHKQENVDIDHLMLPLSPEGKHMADSLRQAILTGADFFEIVDKYSIDPSKTRNKGHLGWINANTYPYSFEEAAYNTPIGDISPVTATRFGYHVIRVKGRRPDQGEVLTSHILRLFSKDRNAETDAAVKAKIDSIYTLATAPGSDFGSIAKSLSEDPGSARNGGQLPWFGAGRMVPEFESAAFSLADGEISKPFATQFGYHIIKRHDSRKSGTFDEERSALADIIKKDPERAERAYTARTEQLKAAYQATVNNRTMDFVKDEIQRHGCFDSALASQFAACAQPLLTSGSTVISVAEYFTRNPIFGTVETATAINRIEVGTEALLNEITINLEKNSLIEKYPEFRNLVNEYRDGMMLFEISNTKVWDRSSKDTEGLNAYFQAHRDKYAFETPRFKGFIITTSSDSVARAVDAYLSSRSDIDPDSVGTELRRNFARNIKVEKVVAPQGANSMVDAIAFGAQAPDMSNNTRWKSFTSYMGRIINQPEEYTDVRGAVATDYQNELEHKWIEEIRAKYPVVINKKVLKKVK